MHHLKIWSLTNHHREKTGSVKSSNLAGHVIYGDPLPIDLAGNRSSKNVRTMLAKCSRALLICFCGSLLRTRPTVRDLAHLQEIIFAAVNNITPQILNTWVEV